MNHRLAFLLIVLTGCTVSNVEESQTRALADYAAAQFSTDRPGGVVLVAIGTDLLLHQAYGLANLEAEEKMKIGQALPIGSITKSFTAGAILRLAEEGKLDLQDNVRKHVPDASVGDYVVTIEQLLTHTSGIPTLVDVDDFFAWAKQKRSTQELLAQTYGASFHFDPGQGFAYSDTGYILLGAVLETLGSNSWDQVIREKVTIPLSLHSVNSAEHAPPPPGYDVVDDTIYEAESIDWSVPHASGSLVATAEDLLHWVHAWRDGAIADSDLLRPAWQARTLPNGTTSGYGYGWKRCNFEGRVAIQHGGWVPGYTASILYLPEEDLTAICMTNGDGGVEAGYLTRRLLRMWLTGSPELSTLTLSQDQQQALIGTYRTGRGTEWNVLSQRNQLYMDLGDGPFELAAISPNNLCAADSDGTWCFTFRTDNTNRVTRVEMSLTCEPQAQAMRMDENNSR